MYSFPLFPALPAGWLSRPFPRLARPGPALTLLALLPAYALTANPDHLPPLAYGLDLSILGYIQISDVPNVGVIGPVRYSTLSPLFLLRYTNIVNPPT